MKVLVYDYAPSGNSMGWEPKLMGTVIEVESMDDDTYGILAGDYKGDYISKENCIPLKRPISKETLENLLMCFELCDAIKSFCVQQTVDHDEINYDQCSIEATKLFMGKRKGQLEDFMNKVLGAKDEPQ